MQVAWVYAFLARWRFTRASNLRLPVRCPHHPRMIRVVLYTLIALTIGACS
ncbi:MAG: hypothetical protein ACI9U2_001290, partial [Bradymonadia bacterium]